ncbi:OTU domain-containing protein 4 isoform X2 [Amia ocellicauda]|uniref:OTU domain-containing protein 4 isoform X2 n=1 Tax=Amia ocellicauda TaxID=2972642 RepID=UPI00346398E0
MAGRTPQQDEQRSSSNAEKFMDEYLQALGLCRKKIAKDGSCLFRAVAEQVLLSQSRHLEVRRTCVDYLAENRQKYEAFIEGSFEEYLQRLENPQNWVGEVEISALALIYKHDFVIFQEPGKPPVNITENNFPDKVQLCFLNGNHYDSIYPKEFVQDAALCQSILYELLYEKVFGVDHETLASSLQSSNGTDEDFTEREDSDESDLDGEEAYWADGEDDITEMNKFRSFQGDKVHKPHHSGFHLPQRVLKSLNPSFFRNVEYDVWQRSKKAQQNMDYCIAAGMQFHIGDKCKVSLDHSGKFYNAYIQEVLPNNGPVVVFVEELAEKRSISLRNIRPSSEEPLPWSTVAEKGKRASTVNGHGTDRDSRGTRKLTKATAKSPLAPSTYIQPAGQSRAQQQLPPWPLVQSQQSPPEDRAGGKAFSTRKCDLGLPCPKGLTDERMAKEAEQESQAQFDILQKDEENFPALSSQKVCLAATQTSAGQKNVNPQTSDRKGSRRRMEAQEQPRESESKTPSHACVRKVEKNKPLAKNTGESCQKKMLSPPPPEQKPSVQNPVSPQQGLVQPLYSPGLPSSDPTPTPSPPASAGPQTATPPSSLTPPALPADPPPYETATSCPAGVMPPMGISSVPPPPAMAELISPARVNVSPMPPPPVHLPPVSQPSMPFPQMQFPYQDPLYPGFPLNEKDEIVAAPSYSYCRNGDDLPRDKCILRFFFNLGLKAYTCPMWPPHSYILPLHQAYLNVCAMQPKVPDPASYTPPWFPETPAAAHRVNSAPPANTMPMQENPGYNLPGPAGVRALGPCFWGEPPFPARVSAPCMQAPLQNLDSFSTSPGPSCQHTILWHYVLPNPNRMYQTWCPSALQTGHYCMQGTA